MSPFFHSDINLFLIDYACFKLLYHYTELHTGGKTLLQLLLKIG